MKSLSSLIKKEDYFRFDIESFEEEDLGGDQDDFLGEAAGHTLTLPLGKERSGRAAPLPHRNQRERLAQLEREAYENGFAQGQKDGLALGERKAEETGKQMLALLNVLSGLKEQVLRETEAEMIRLSMTVARKIVKKEVSLDPAVVRHSLDSALQFLKDKSFMRVLINPRDMKHLEAYLPEVAMEQKIRRFELAEDSCVDPGGCVLETGFGRINAGLESQLDELEKVIQEAFHHKLGPESGSDA